MCACEEACEEECPMESTYDILPLLAPPIPIILLMAWWASILLSREIHTPHEQPGRPIKYFNLKDLEKEPGSGKRRVLVGLRHSESSELIFIELPPDEDQPHIMLEESSADSTTPATTHPKNGNKPKDK